MGKLEGKVAFITGAARGQGRSHAVVLASEGADIIAVDICKPLASRTSSPSTSEDLDETRRLVEAVGGRIFTAEADVRDQAALQAALDAGISALGTPDIVLANAGVALFQMKEHPDAWKDTIDINLTGVFNTVEVATPSMVAAGKGGAIVITGSTASVRGAMAHSPGQLAYGASKHGVLGLMRSYSNIFAPHKIRVNAVLPSAVATPMVLDSDVADVIEHFGVAANWSMPMSDDLLEPEDVSRAILYLVSEDGRFVTGIGLPVDAGASNRA